MMECDSEGCNRIVKEYLQESTMQEMCRFKSDKPMTEEQKNQEIDNINASISKQQINQVEYTARIDNIINVANSFTFSKKLIESLEKEFRDNPKEEFAQHCLRDTL